MTPYNPQMWKADPSMNTNGMGFIYAIGTTNVYES